MRSAARALVLFALVAVSCVVEASSQGEAKVKAISSDKSAVLLYVTAGLLRQEKIGNAQTSMQQGTLLSVCRVNRRCGSGYMVVRVWPL